MKFKFLKYFFIFSFLHFFIICGYSQFYNGSQLTFGKNRVQFEERYWSYLRFKRYDVYYYKEGKSLAVYTARYADKKIGELEKKLEYTLESKIQFIVYNKYSELKQSNIGLNDEDLYNTGGVTHIVGTKVFLYFDGDHKKLEQQIQYGIANIILNELLYGQSYFTRLKNSTLINFPDWYIEGLLYYLSYDWNTEIDNKIKDGILSGKYKKFSHLQGQDAINAGTSIWKYVEIKYGANNIPNIIYMSKINRNVENGFLFVLGVSFKTLIKDWYDYYYNYKYLPISKETNQPPEDFILKKIKKSRVYSQLKISNSGEYVAYTTNELGQYKVWLYSLSRKKAKWIMKREHKLDEKTDYSYPILAWHPSGRILSIIIEAKGKTWLYFYSMDTRKFDKRPVYLFDKILDMSYNDKGDKMVLSAVQKGHSDIFVYNIASNTFEAITKDIYDDRNPRFINNSKDIIFSSNRSNDTLKPNIREEEDDYKMIEKSQDLFIYHYNYKSNVLRRVSNTDNADEIMPEQYDKQHITYLSDANGILNRYVAKLDSAVSFVDTTIHYRQFVTSFPVTNNLYNIQSQSFSSATGKYSEIVHNKGIDKMYINDIPDAKTLQAQNLKNYLTATPKENKPETEQIQNPKTEIRNQADTGYIYIQSKTRHKGFTGVYVKPNAPVRDSNKIDINNYSFSKNAEKIRKTAKADSIDKKSQIINQQNTIQNPQSAIRSPQSLMIPRARNANVEYSISQIVNQIDFNYLNTGYQTFSGGSSPIYINPGFNAFFKVGANDLFEDYRLVGGIRLSPTLVDNEYFVSFSNLKYRLDRELVLHRITLDNSPSGSGAPFYRTHTDEALYIIKYTFSEVSAIKLTGTLRDDRYVNLSTDLNSLKNPNTDRLWTGLKGEYIFDNTRNKGINLYYGTRYKIFAEYFRQDYSSDKQLNSSNHDLFVVGLDYRHYIKISKTFIWANRFAASSSFGMDKLIYYMGGVDTWLNPSFDSNTNVAKDQNYAFQTLATPMRGFKQNVRNGNSFAVINSELRFPVFKYFAKRPIKSDFISNFQVIAFTDIGTAWTGPNPYSDKNSLYTQMYTSGPITVTIKNQSDPIVEGYGMGLRSRLFGYFIRADYAWGVEDGVVQKPIFYLSLCLDF